MNLTLWAYASRFTGLASSMLILPFGLHYLPTEQFSIWMIFIAVYGLIIVFDFGLSLTFSRKVNYVYSSLEDKEKRAPAGGFLSLKEEYSRIFNSSVTVFSIISLLSAVVLALFYFFYFPIIEGKLGYRVALEWSLFSSAIFIQIICLIFNVVYFGLSKNIFYYKCLSISNLIFMVLSIVLLILEWELMAISIGRFVSSVLLLLGLFALLNKTEHRKLYDKKSKLLDWDYIKSVLPSSLSLGGVSLSNYLSSKSAVFFVSAYFPLEQAAKFSLTHNIFSIITSVSLIYMTAHNPKININYKSGNFDSFISLQNKIRLVSLVFPVPIIVCLLLFGNPILNWIGSETLLLTLGLLMLFSVFSILDINRNVSQYFIMASDEVPFLKSSVISAAAIVLLSLFAYEMGFTYIVLSILIPLLVQLSFNFWYWSVEEVKLRNKVSHVEKP
ncbi:oligosaccharide flippase family protein [Pseudoalteromonas luteoviolacea]|uniref:Polysaccharide biosynthesis protein C-terminal domain-containing protein n=1 Tax=Pseudoalteromonas luteoviolacea S4060-1 TaxID=1365257 RepID=A0A167NLQ2_9GAMM|nr:oligosaccharide flippase family protein [Pseudoalteromonas luteoviolacea]KZN68468.1 hypothetical protein N478_14995 [Pseudoalteromonas luteoviolacea S4060-1]